MTTKAENREYTRNDERSGGATELPRKVIRHDDRTPINWVVWVLRRIISGMTMKRATRVTWEVYNKG
jgi:ATP-dependent Clp protease adapter protein ClpS